MLTAEQTVIRRRTIGASEAAAAIGLSKWKTPIAVYLEKIGMAESSSDSEAMYWGTVFEEPIAQRYAKDTEKKLETIDTIVSKQYPFMSCNLDRKIVGENAAVECKNVGFFSEEWGQPGTDQVPTDYLIQVAHQAIVCDLDYVDIAVLGNRYHFRMYRYVRNKELEEKIIKAERKFWHEHVLKEIAPEPKTCEDLKHLYPDANDSSLEANSDIEELVSLYNECKTQEKEFEKKANDAKVKIANFMGEASILTSRGEKMATYKMQETMRLSSTDIKNDLPEIYEKYSKKSSCRVFRSY